MKWYVIFLAMIFLSCSKKEVPLKISCALCADVCSLDPRVGYDTPSVNVIRTLFDGLMRFNEMGEVIPGIAEKVVVSSNGMRYTFFLRDAKWSDGEPVTADDFEYAWKKGVDPTTITQSSFLFHVLKNGKGCALGEKSLDELGVKALNAKTLQVELDHPLPYFLKLLTVTPFNPIPKHIAEKDDKWATKLDHQFVSNGPFCLEERKIGDQILVKKNPHYWDADVVKLDQIAFLVIQDANTQLLMFEKGDIDWVGSPFGHLPLDALDSLKEKYQLNTGEQAGVMWCFLNTEKYPLNSKHLRRALFFAMNRRALNDQAYIFHPLVPKGVLPHMMELQTSEYPPEGDPMLAKKELELAREELGLGDAPFPSIRLAYTALERNHRFAQTIQQDIRKTLGIDIQLESSDWPTYFKHVSSGEYAMGLMGWTSRTYDPLDMLATFRNKENSINFSRWQNDEYQYLLNCAEQTIELEPRLDFLRQAEAILMQEFPVICLFTSAKAYLYNPRLSHFTVSSLDEVDLKTASLDR
ncbi:MAG: peptide ABC transporter substrate-binding protein [Simkaniaceae bacterium]|nr:peptide ABC transporter substrate-binding protein [Simkaniaceae bacterium]